MHAHLQHPQPGWPVVLPQRLVPLHVAVAAEDVVDQHVQAASLVADGGHQGIHLAGVLVVNYPCGARPADGADQVTGFLDRLRAAHLRGAGGSAAAAGRVHEEPSPGQVDGDRPARAPGSAGHQGDRHRFGSISHGISKQP
jgi:hypothetical protein